MCRARLRLVLAAATAMLGACDDYGNPDLAGHMAGDIVYGALNVLSVNALEE